MKVNEVFFSIQGESTFAGRPCVFVRLAGCDQHCSYCDTSYASEDGETLSIDEVLGKVRPYGCRLVEITGGEPLVQEETFPLVSLLLELGYEVLVETSGCVEVGRLDVRAVKIMDLKCPGSGVSESICWSNIECLTRKDQVKFVIGDRSDYEWAKETMKTHRLAEKSIVLLSPVFGKLEPRQLAEWMLEDRLDARLQLQLHKLIWGAESRGV